MVDNSYSDDDSDSTVEETLVMLNLPQLINSNNILKNLSSYRKKDGALECPKEENSISIEGDHTNIKNLNPVFSKNNLTNVAHNSNSDVTDCKEENNIYQFLKMNENIKKKKEKNLFKMNKELSDCDIMKKAQNNSNEKKYDENESIEKESIENESIENESIEIESVDKDGLVITDVEKNKTNVDAKNKINSKEVDKIPFNINSISLSNLFTDFPECVINNKYKFKGIHTSSIGTNLYFKEPENLKKNEKNICTKSEVLHDFNENIKNENKKNRDDFTVYEGYSTKIISFEIDY
ncbi:conserved protein, unknown function [Hepatocystis sp. ex Piliocolobus tephrosceles]|nr:conserved protein, unknown function [Hepatocystis sp. ex Piliocolobus tephrosceles]